MNNDTSLDCFLAFSSAAEKCGRGGGGGRDNEGRIAIAEDTGYESPRDCSLELGELKLVARGRKRAKKVPAAACVQRPTRRGGRRRRGRQ
jgi:hypothetical protein